MPPNNDPNDPRFPRLRNAARAALFLTPAGRNILSSPAGGLAFSQFANRDFRQREDEALAQVGAVNQQGQDIVAGLGVGQQISDSIDNFPAGVRTELQRRIDAGEPLGELQRFIEPSVTERAGDIAEVGIAQGGEVFDPESAFERFMEQFAPIVEGLEALPGQVATSSQQVQEFFTQESADLASEAAGLNAGNAALLENARGLVSSLGGQERADINRQFDEAGSNLQARLAQRGLGGSTISASLGTGVARERTDALGRLNERLINQQLGVEQTFGLSAQGAQERLIGADVNLGSQQAQALQVGNQQFAATAAGALANLGNIAGAQVGAFDQAAVNRQNNLLQFGGFQTDAQLQAAQLGLGFTGQFAIGLPTANQGLNIFPPFQ